MPVESHPECGALNAANAAKTGLLSARMATSGINGPNSPLESNLGWSDMLEKMYLCLDGFYTRTDINRIATRVRGFDQTKHFSSIAMFT